MTDTAADLSVHFADACAHTRYDDLPRPAAEAAKKSILDTLGVILAASGTEPAVTGVLDLAREIGGRGEASILPLTGLYPATEAAFANGAMAHCLDFDDQTPWGQHCASSIVPAVLALAERKGDVEGRRLITAVAVGQDLFARLRRNVAWRKDWNLSSVLAVYAATAASAKILELSADSTKHALGIASMHSAGVMEMVCGTGSSLRGMYAGFSARGAVNATLLAERGVTGIERLFEGEYGILATYFGGRYDREAMLDGLGHTFQGADTLYKAWPSVGTSHSHIQATIDLVTAHDLTEDDISEIRVHVGDYHDLMCRPLDARRAPVTLADAKFSLPFLVGLAAVRRDVGIIDFTLDSLRDAQVTRAAAKVVPVPDPELDWVTELPAGRVRIVVRDGRILDGVGDRVPGSLERPMTWDELDRKFADCAAVAARPTPADQIARVQTAVRDLESVSDAAELTRLLTSDTTPDLERLGGIQ
ncbi:MmgE/PrpD family protein [Saccharopolyspora mangrovi]|uniref:MmgE/PrpD family protein n=1 Tax=Saccharopolyspora mangrovi TaxID=3082379 RepID=A0ABU6ALG0_9PSEU|nr:MmgE/PrpD family protein [Saccharopolyspora sp. S2-29]MEB3372348.1 MmgE/PrpD family protein [Saccharopolyspora sp. S2-29]